MYVSRIHVENIKSFHGPRVVDLSLTRPDGSHAGWTVVAGRNGSGKTTLLRAIALAISGPNAARALGQGPENWVSEGALFGSVEVGIVPDPKADFLFGRISHDVFDAGLSWRSPELIQPSTSGARRGSMSSLIPTGRISTAEQGPWSEDPYGWLCAAYGPFRRMTGGSAEAQRLMLMSGPVSRQASLFHEDASLAEGVAWLIDQHLRALEGRPGAVELKNAALSVLGDGLLPDDYRVVDVDADGLWVERDGRRFPLREMSDGLRTVTALVVDLLKQIQAAYADYSAWSADDNPPSPTQFPGVVIIDEIDAHLHVSWQRRIGPWLTSHFPNIQFIVTTHSPYICQAADPGGLIRLPGAGEDVAPEVVPEDLYERVVYGSGDDAVLSDLFGLDTPYSEQAEQIRAEFVMLEGRVYEGDTSAQTVSRYKELANLLTSSTSTRVVELSARLERIAADIEAERE